MKVKVYVFDLPIPPFVKKWGMRVGFPALGVLVGGVALAGLPGGYADGQPLTAEVLTSNFTYLQGEIAQLQGLAPCPEGYTQDTTQTTFVDCTNGTDEVVQVGTGSSAFWIDRYEASVWNGTTQVFNGVNSSSPTFPANGQTAVHYVAQSVAGVLPAVLITWFQAVEACAAAGKRLPDGQEWIRAARNTIDPGSSDGSNGACNTDSGALRNTGLGTACQSDWGAQDMIGNAQEWTSEWYAGVGDAAVPNGVWTSGFNSDYTGNIVSSAIDLTGAPVVGLPSVGRRGGNFSSGVGGGVFAFDLNAAPSFAGDGNGFRCVIPR